jgi:RNA polymerase sigma factor (TIGR02999 family)
MKEAGKRCLRVTRVQVQKALLSAKAKSPGKSDQGSERISLIARSRGRETQHDYWRLIFSFNRLTLPPRAPIFVFKRSASGLKSEGKLPQLPSNTFNELLATWQAGDDEALRAVFPRVYNELRRVAHRYLRKERPDHTLQSAALVHEAYLRLEKQRTGPFENREHFIAICAQLMRQILVEHARGRRAAKRDGGYRLSLNDGLAGKSPTVDMIALDDALNELARLDRQQSRIVEMRFFGGLSIDETACALNLSPTTVKRHWATARLWLHRQMNNTADL